jgi:NAD-dependent dihydropyrimidine dehydrogenase PreA subunit
LTFREKYSKLPRLFEGTPSINPRIIPKTFNLLVFGDKLPTNKEETSMFQVTVDADKCTGDSNCVDTCPVSVFELQDNKAVPVNMDECLGCESCVEVCETGAIVVKEV